jgi:excisionase family DNA binding protein
MSNRNQPSKDDRALMTVEEVAGLLGLSVSTVYSMVAARKLPFLRLGNGRGVIRFSRAQIDTYLASKAVGTQEQKTPEPTRRISLKHISLD